MAQDRDCDWLTGAVLAQFWAQPHEYVVYASQISVLAV
jgi:hypothetical protein